VNFDLSADQRMLEDSLARLVADRYALDQRADYARRPEGWSRDLWRAFVDLGLTMLPFAEGDGGLGLGGVETMLVGQAFGRGLMMEPYLPCVVLAGTAIARCPASGERSRHLFAIMDGSAIYALADREQVTADRADCGWRLSGALTLVLGGDSADRIVVFGDRGVFIASTDAAGLTRRAYRLHGGGGAADIALDGVAATRLGDGDSTHAIEAGIAFLAAEAAGAMASALAVTVDYLKTREQFGKPIGANQALQHRAAEMAVEAEQARSAAIYAALLTEEPDADERGRGYAAVKAVIGKSGAFVAQQVVHLHGGIGVSEEHIASHYFRRLTAIGMLLGDTDAQITRLATLGGFTGAALPT